MNISKDFFLVLITSLLFHLSAFTQINSTGYKLSKYQNWQLLDYQQDSVYGASVNRVYNELPKGKKSHPVIVAVIDEGVDINHEDLQGHIWANKKEIAGNGIDDDKNGYVDDIHGWNFLGGTNGKMMYATSSEADREYARLLARYSAVKDSSQLINNKEYQYFLRAKKKHRRDSAGRNSGGNYIRVSNLVRQLQSADSLMQKATGKQVIYYNDVESFVPKDSLATATKAFLLAIYNRRPQLRFISLDSGVKAGKEALVTLKDYQVFYKQLQNDPLQLRKEIIGDDPFNINDRVYGNNIVGDKYADHGTHCSGIIAAVRNNGIGIDGVADNVIIMPLRAVNTTNYGDEMDKDIALSIQYAADNGAKIISMSFGKTFSPQKSWVDDAVKYAQKKGVLLVHAALNDNSNNDSINAFPSASFLNSSGRADNFITVGATSIDTGFALTASFSNYGQKEVDLFAPGAAIYSAVPGNKYDFMSGTSMATPLVAGIAALLLEYYPALTAQQLKQIIMQSVTSLKGKMVYKPGTREKVDVSTPCVSGGVVNAYKALQLAADIARTQKMK